MTIAGLTESSVPALKLILHDSTVVRCICIPAEECGSVDQDFDAQDCVECACHIVANLDMVVGVAGRPLLLKPVERRAPPQQTGGVLGGDAQHVVDVALERWVSFISDALVARVAD